MRHYIARGNTAGTVLANAVIRIHLVIIELNPGLVNKLLGRLRETCSPCSLMRIRYATFEQLPPRRRALLNLQYYEEISYNLFNVTLFIDTFSRFLMRSTKYRYEFL